MFCCSCHSRHYFTRQSPTKMCTYTPTNSYFTDGSHLLAQANLRDALTVADGINQRYLNDLQLFEMNTHRWFLKTMQKCHPDKATTD